MSTRLHERNDRSLWPLIDATDEAAQDAAIERLLAEQVKPAVCRIVQRFRRIEPNLQLEDLEEIASAATVRVIRRVRAARIGEEFAIAALDDYLATVTYNAYYDFRRRRYPERHRLKRNLRYLVTRDRSFALWEGDDGFVAGLAAWKGQRAKEPAPFMATAAMRDPSRPAEAVRALFRHVGHALSFDALVDVMAELWDVREAIVESSGTPPHEEADQLSSLEQREYLETLWSEIRALPDHQRTALLLNLRDGSGASALTLFLLLNVVDAPDLARVAGLGEEELNELWERLPLDDATIAARLKLSRQQVINLRKSARERLARRMAKWK